MMLRIRRATQQREQQERDRQALDQLRQRVMQTRRRFWGDVARLEDALHRVRRSIDATEEERCR